MFKAIDFAYTKFWDRKREHSHIFICPNLQLAVSKHDVRSVTSKAGRMGLAGWTLSSQLCSMVFYSDAFSLWNTCKIQKAWLCLLHTTNVKFHRKCLGTFWLLYDFKPPLFSDTFISFLEYMAKQMLYGTMIAQKWRNSRCNIFLL